MAVLTVLVDHRLQRGPVRRRRGREGQPGLPLWRQEEPRGQRAHRVQAGVEGDVLGAGGPFVEQGARCAGIAVAAQPAPPVGLLAQALDLRTPVGQEVRRLQSRLTGQARPPLEVQGRLGRLCVRTDEEVAKSRMRFVPSCVCQRDLEGRDDLGRQFRVAQVVQFDLSELDVVLGAHPDRDAGAQVGPMGLEAHTVGMEHTLIACRRVRRRVLGQREERAALGSAKVEKVTPGIAQRVVAPAVDAHAPAAAGACAVGAQAHAVVAVGQQLRRLDRMLTRRQHAHEQWRSRLQRDRQRVGRRCMQTRDLARGALVQQRDGGLDVRVGHAPALRHAVQQHVGQRHQRHALVVGHEGLDADQRRALHLAAALARGREVQRLEKTQPAARAKALECRQVQAGVVRCDLGRQRSGVGRDHQLVGRCAAQCQSRHTLRRILVGQGVVAARVGRFRDSPGHTMCRRVAALLDQRRGARLEKHTAARLGQHQCRHEVLEHRARPRAQGGGRADGVERAPERPPVAHRHVTLGDGQQAGQP